MARKKKYKPADIPDFLQGELKRHLALLHRIEDERAGYKRMGLGARFDDDLDKQTEEARKEVKAILAKALELDYDIGEVLDYFADAIDRSRTNIRRIVRDLKLWPTKKPTRKKPVRVEKFGPIDWPERTKLAKKAERWASKLKELAGELEALRAEAFDTYAHLKNPAKPDLQLEERILAGYRTAELRELAKGLGITRPPTRRDLLIAAISGRYNADWHRLYWEPPRIKALTAKKPDALIAEAKKLDVPVPRHRKRNLAKWKAEIAARILSAREAKKAGRPNPYRLAAKKLRVCRSPGLASLDELAQESPEYAEVERAARDLCGAPSIEACNAFVEAAGELSDPSAALDQLGWPSEEQDKLTAACRELGVTLPTELPF